VTDRDGLPVADPPGACDIGLVNALPQPEPIHRILVVEDDADVRDLLMLCLDSLVPGAQSARAENGLVALRRLREEGPWSLVLCDIMMPGLDGARLMRDLHSQGALADQKFLVLTAVPEGQVSDLLKQPGVVGYVQKPVDPMALASKVRALLGSS